MEEKLKILYKQSINELENLGINVSSLDIGKINICISKKSNKRYGCCKQENPDRDTKYYEKIGRKKYLRFGKYKNHIIEISEWVLNLDDKIIKNTILHEIIHCLPYCNNHGKEFKKYAKIINEKLGYNISRLGNKEKDYEKSNLKYEENIEFKYKIICKKCNQIFYRQRLKENLIKKYRCGKCGGKFEIINL